MDKLGEVKDDDFEIKKNEDIEEIIIKGIMENPEYAKLIFSEEKGITPELFHSDTASVIFKHSKNYYQENKSIVPKSTLIELSDDKSIGVINFLTHIERLDFDTVKELKYLLEESNNYLSIARRIDFVKDLQVGITDETIWKQHMDKASTLSVILSGGYEELLEENLVWPELEFNKDWMVGPGRDFAEIYNQHYPETPVQFFYFLYLTCLGIIISKKVKLNVPFYCQPRLYLLLIGKSGVVKKTQSMINTIKVFKDFEGEDYRSVYGMASGEALIRTLDETNQLLWVMDELKTFVSKTRVSASTLLTHMSSLFDTNKAENPKMKKDDSLVVENGHLSVIAACTPETFEEVWLSSFTNIGLDFRFFLVPGETSKDVFKVANMMSATLFPEEILDEQKAKVSQIYDWVNDIESGPKAADKKLISFSNEAWKLYTGWRQHLATVGQLNRIDNIACRIAMLMAISIQKHEIDEKAKMTYLKKMNVF